jgi:hypothetical protein
MTTNSSMSVMIKLEGTYKQAVIAYFMAQFHYMPKKAEKKHYKPYGYQTLNQQSNLGQPECEEF